jgi:HEPN domain-containing protein
LANSKIVKQWFNHAARDLKMATIALSFSADLKNESAFHSQQCIEKALKGYLVYSNIRPPKTHDIQELAKLLVGAEPNLSGLIRNAKELSSYAVTYRYPSAELKPLTLAKAKSALNISKKIFDFLLNQMSKDNDREL